MSTFYQAVGIVEAKIDRAKKTMYVTWHQLNGHDHIRPCCEAQLKEVKRGAKVMILDVSSAEGVVTREDQTWFGETLFPQFSSAGLEAMINVLPKNAISKLSSRSWMRTASPFSFDIYEAASVYDAEELAKTLREEPAKIGA